MNGVDFKLEKKQLFENLQEESLMNETTLELYRDYIKTEKVKFARQITKLLQSITSEEKLSELVEYLKDHNAYIKSDFWKD